MSAAEIETKPQTITVKAYSNLYFDSRTPFYPHADRGPSHGRTFAEGDPLFLAASMEVPTKEAEKMGELLEYVFRELNIGDASDLARQWRGNRCASLSVGDVVVVGESAYAVARFGYEAVSLVSEQIKTSEERGV